MQSPPFHRYLVHPRSKYSPQHLVLKHPQLPISIALIIVVVVVLILVVVVLVVVVVVVVVVRIAVAQCLRRCAIYRKVVGSIPDSVTGIFH